MLTGFSAQANAALQSARGESERLKQYYLGVEHLFLGLCATSNAVLRDALGELGVEPGVVSRLRDAMLSEEEPPPWGESIIQTPRLQRVLQRAGRLRAQQRHALVSSSHLMLSILSEPKSLPVRTCVDSRVDLEAFQRVVEGLAQVEAQPAGTPPLAATKTPALDRFGRDLTWLAAAQRLDPLIGRTEEIHRLALVLRKKAQNNALIIGEAGTGKTHLVEGLAAEMVRPTSRATEGLQGKRIIEIDLNSMVAGTTYRGDFEARLEAILKEAKDPQIILFIDEFHLVLGAGAASGSQGAAQILKPYLARGEIRCIGATTNDEYRRFVEADKALARRFETITLSEPPAEETLAILRGLVRLYETHHQVAIEDDALQASVEYGGQYIRGRCFPEKAIELLDLACAQAGLAGDAAAAIGRRDIAQVVFQKTGIRPLADRDVRVFLNGLAELLARQVIGQSEVVETVVGVVRKAQLGLARPGRPQGVVLLCGPSGVGKTQLVKSVAAALFPGRSSLVQLNMSEYAEPISVSALIGAPPAYVGHEQGGSLTEAVRRNPFSVVLLDEIEKAHPDIWRLFLQVFDEGCLTDRNGRVADFTNTFIFLTSNLGSGAVHAKAPIGFVDPDGDDDGADYGRLQAAVRSAVEKSFSAEFRNRLDATVVFRPLSVPVLRKIIDKELEEVGQLTGLRQSGVVLRLDETAYAELIRHGYSPQYGARQLKRAIDRVVLLPLGAHLSQAAPPPGTRLVAAVRDGHTEFSIELVRA